MAIRDRVNQTALALSLAAAGGCVAAGIMIEQLGRGVQRLGHTVDRVFVGWRL